MLFRLRIGALVLIVVDTLFLSSNLGWIPQLGPIFHKWWPLVLIIVVANPTSVRAGRACPTVESGLLPFRLRESEA